MNTITFKDVHDELALKYQAAEFNFVNACKDPLVSANERESLKRIVLDTLRDYNWFIWSTMKFDIEPEDEYLS